MNNWIKLTSCDNKERWFLGRTISYIGYYEFDFEKGKGSEILVDGQWTTVKEDVQTILGLITTEETL